MLLGLTRVAIEVMALFLAAHSRICFLDIRDDNAMVLTPGSFEKVVRLGLCGDAECRVRNQSGASAQSTARKEVRTKNDKAQRSPVSPEVPRYLFQHSHIYPTSLLHMSATQRHASACSSVSLSSHHEVNIMASCSCL